LKVRLTKTKKRAILKHQTNVPYIINFERIEKGEDVDLIKMMARVKSLSKNVIVVILENGLEIAYEKNDDEPNSIKYALLPETEIFLPRKNNARGAETQKTANFGDGMLYINKYNQRRQTTLRALQVRSKELYLEVMGLLGAEEYYALDWERFKTYLATAFSWPWSFLRALYLQKTTGRPSKVDPILAKAPVLIPFLIKELIIPDELQDKHLKFTNEKLLATNSKDSTNAAIDFSFGGSPDKFSNARFYFSCGLELNQYGLWGEIDTETMQRKYQSAKHFFQLDPEIDKELHDLHDTKLNILDHWDAFNQELKGANHIDLLKHIGLIK